jgi:Ribosomal protein L13e
MKHNNVIPNAHFHKHWQERVRCYFNQAPQKKTRRSKRAAKAKAVFPRPVSGLLRPIVRCQTLKYNSKTRLGRGFTLVELKVCAHCGHLVCVCVLFFFLFRDAVDLALQRESARARVLV